MEFVCKVGAVAGIKFLHVIKAYYLRVGSLLAPANHLPKNDKGLLLFDQNLNFKIKVSIRIFLSLDFFFHCNLFAWMLSGSSSIDNLEL